MTTREDLQAMVRDGRLRVVRTVSDHPQPPLVFVDPHDVAVALGLTVDVLEHRLTRRPGPRDEEGWEGVELADGVDGHPFVVFELPSMAVT